MLDGLVVREIDGVKATRFEHWGKELPKFTAHLREWGEAGIVCTRDIKTSKLSNKGVLCMFVGYALQHAGDCYRMYNPKTKKIMISRDIKWMNEMFYNIQDDTQTTKVTDTSHDIDSLNDDDLSIPDIQNESQKEKAPDTSYGIESLNDDDLSTPDDEPRPNEDENLNIEEPLDN